MKYQEIGLKVSNIYEGTPAEIVDLMIKMENKQWEQDLIQKLRKTGGHAIIVGGRGIGKTAFQDVVNQKNSELIRLNELLNTKCEKIDELKKDLSISESRVKLLEDSNDTVHHQLDKAHKKLNQLGDVKVAKNERIDELEKHLDSMLTAIDHDLYISTLKEGDYISMKKTIEKARKCLKGE